MAKKKTKKENKTKRHIIKKKPRDGYWFKCLRTAFHLKQSELAYYANTTASSVSNFETGRGIVSQELKHDLYDWLAQLIKARAELYGIKKTKICLNRAKLDFAEYYEMYDIFVVSTWATEVDTSTVDDAIAWNGINDWGDVI